VRVEKTGWRRLPPVNACDIHAHTNPSIDWPTADAPCGAESAFSGMAAWGVEALEELGSFPSRVGAPLAPLADRICRLMSIRAMGSYLTPKSVQGVPHVRLPMRFWDPSEVRQPVVVVVVMLLMMTMLTTMSVWPPQW
jgi:hypothetical protein